MFITFEGTEGTGKTTIIKRILDYLVNQGYDVLYTREPGGSKIAEQIRSVLLNPDNQAISYRTEALLFAASRAQHLDEVIIPALNQKRIILCDRYLDSSIAYQAFGRELGLEYILKINSYALDYLPNLTIYIDLDPTIGVKRVKNNRSHKLDRLDLALNDFHQRARLGYLYQAEQNPNRIKVINGNQTIEEVYQAVFALIKEVL